MIRTGSWVSQRVGLGTCHDQKQIAAAWQSAIDLFQTKPRGLLSFTAFHFVEGTVLPSLLSA